MTQKFLCVHGHFYQPPRENPWTNSIELQESALPSHDWNERIYQECYKPNSCSHVLTPDGQITEIINNYEYMSFNMGPTLLGWIRAKHPRTYYRILQADKDSAERLNGHGNAMAQVYNHIIMPLASDRDRITQIRWGVRDFEKHYDRKPDSIWLAETGINMDTVVDLIKEGIKFVVLAPSQAWRFRKLGSKSDKDWDYREHADIDTSRPYRILPTDENGKRLCEGHLDVFFYHDMLSRGVSFQGLLNSAGRFNDEIQSGFSGEERPELVNMATDGESYGHHHKHGDMCLSYFFKKLAPYSDLEVVNYSYYLEEFPPEYEVQIKNQWGEGTAWSCAHGVGRWYRDCGCQTGGPEDWNQQWRTPLRDSLNYLKDIVDEIYESQMSQLSFQDPWDIRNDYVEVLFDPEIDSIIDAFCDRWMKEGYTEKQKTEFLQLMEMQKFALFSFTSCGWFFNDIEGLEPTQNLKYARRAMELVRDLTGNMGFEKKFQEILAGTTSNENKMPGDVVYQKFASPEIQVRDRILGAAVFGGGFTHNSFDRKLWKFQCHGKVIKQSDHYRLWDTQIRDIQLNVSSSRYLLSLRSDFQEDVLFIFPEGTKAERIELPAENFLTKSDACLFYPMAKSVTVGSLFNDHIQQICDQKTRESFEDVCREFKDFPKRYNFFYGLIERNSVEIPEYISTPIKLSLTAEINFLVRDLLENANFDSMNLLENYVSHANQMNISLNTKWIQGHVIFLIETWIKEVVEDDSREHLVQLSNLIHVCDIMGIEIDKAEIQNYSYPLFVKYRNSSTLKKMKEWQPFINLFDWLGFQTFK